MFYEGKRNKENGRGWQKDIGKIWNTSNWKFVFIVAMRRMRILYRGPALSLSPSLHLYLSSFSTAHRINLRPTSYTTVPYARSRTARKQRAKQSSWNRQNILCFRQIYFHITFSCFPTSFRWRFLLYFSLDPFSTFWNATALPPRQATAPPTVGASAFLSAQILWKSKEKSRKKNRKTKQKQKIVAAVVFIIFLGSACCVCVCVCGSFFHFPTCLSTLTMTR